MTGKITEKGTQGTTEKAKRQRRKAEYFIIAKGYFSGALSREEAVQVLDDKQLEDVYLIVGHEVKFQVQRSLKLG